MNWVVALFRLRLRGCSKSRQLRMARNPLKLFEFYPHKNWRFSPNRPRPTKFKKSLVNQCVRDRAWRGGESNLRPCNPN